jgi:ElaB/YqjD/DUF883 family membrane-anchored ribosome-binding protein
LSRSRDSYKVTDNISEKLEDVKAVAEKSKAQVEGLIKSRPVESAGIIFIAGLLLGVLLGAMASHRD